VSRRDDEQWPADTGEMLSGMLEGLSVVGGDHEKLAQLGCDLVNRLFVLTRNTLLFDLNNEALDRPVQAFLDSLAGLNEAGEGRASIGVIDDNLFLNRNLLKPDPSTFKNGLFLGRTFRRLSAQEFRFDCEIGEEELRDFMQALRKVVEGKEDKELLNHLEGFKLVPLTKAEAGSDNLEIDSRIEVLRTFAGSVALIARVMALAARGMKWNPSIVRRVAYDLSECSIREPDLLLGLMHLPVSESRLGIHLVRVAILSVLCAQKLKLPLKMRAELAMSAPMQPLARRTPWRRPWPSAPGGGSTRG
jgi:hypothetical protein